MLETHVQKAKKTGLRKRENRKRREKEENEEGNFKCVFSSKDLASSIGTVKL